MANTSHYESRVLSKCFHIEPAARHPELGALPDDRQQKTKPFDYQPLDAPLTTNASISRTHDGLCSISDLELAQDIRDVVSYGFEAEDQLPGNRRVALTLRDQAEHLPFAFGEFGKCHC